MTGAAYSAYQYDYVGGVFSGSQFTFTSVPTGASYSYYETDYDRRAISPATASSSPISRASATPAKKRISTGRQGLERAAHRIVDQAYSSLKLDYSAGTYEGYEACYTAITGQSFASEEVGVSAAGQLEEGRLLEA